MPFDELDFRELIQLLEKRPEWRAELRRLLLTDELLRLPELVAQLAQQLVTRVDRHEQLLQQILEVQLRHEQILQEHARLHQRHEERLERLEQLAQQILEMQRHHEQILQEHAAILREHTAALQEQATILQTHTMLLQRHDQHLDQIEQDLAPLKGMHVEWKICRHAPAYLSRFVRRCRLLSHEELDDLLEPAFDAGLITEDEWDELHRADFVLRGRSRVDQQELYLVVEASWGIGKGDVEHAIRRAHILEKMGKRAMPVVMGRWIAPPVRQLAHEGSVGIALIPRET